MGRRRSNRGEALVAIVNNPADWRIVQSHLWYRIPVESTPKRFPPDWLAFYHTKIFKDAAHSIRYYGRVADIRRVQRGELFPDELPNRKSERWYHQLRLESIETLPRPIVSYRLRRVVFIPTTYHKLMTADEINDLFDDSPLEEALWYKLKALKLQAERQYFTTLRGTNYFLDFALFCENGKLNIETDGDTWHADPDRIPEDNRRDNALVADDWRVMRFNTTQIREQMESYCVPHIAKTVSELGGLEQSSETPRQYIPTSEGIVQQLMLFDRKTAYETETED